MTTLLKNLTLDQLRDVYKTNNDFAYAVREIAYENNMYAQEDISNEMLGKENRGYSYHDHYTSFYFRLTDAEKFVDDLPKCCREYLPMEHKGLYDTAKELLAKWQDMTWDEQDADEYTFSKLEGTATELLKAIEDVLHDYEDVTDDDVEDALQAIIDDCLGMSDWELQDDGKTIAEYKTKLYK